MPGGGGVQLCPVPHLNLRTGQPRGASAYIQHYEYINTKGRQLHFGGYIQLKSTGEFEKPEWPMFCSHAKYETG